jgi:hypothetical protein
LQQVVAERREEQVVMVEQVASGAPGRVSGTREWMARKEEAKREEMRKEEVEREQKSKEEAEMEDARASLVSVTVAGLLPTLGGIHSPTTARRTVRRSRWGGPLVTDSWSDGTRRWGGARRPTSGTSDLSPCTATGDTSPLKGDCTALNCTLCLGRWSSSRTSSTQGW